MNAIVVFESLWGNTAAIARAVADGIGPQAQALHTDEATAACVSEADLVVCGAPLLGFSLPTEQMRQNIRQNPGSGPVPPDLDHPSMRGWVEALPEGGARYATFETRIWWSPGSAAKTVAKLLDAKGYVAAAPAEKFLVTGRYGPLKAGEVERARAWGAQIAAALE